MSDRAAVLVGYAVALGCALLACESFVRLAAGGHPLWFAGAIANAYGSILAGGAALQLHMTFPCGLFRRW